MAGQEPVVLTIDQDWQGIKLPDLVESQSTSYKYHISFKISPISGDLVINVDAPFHGDPPPSAVPVLSRKAGFTKEQLVPSVPSSPPPALTASHDGKSYNYFNRFQIVNFNIQAGLTLSSDTNPTEENDDMELYIDDGIEPSAEQPPTEDFTLDKYHYPGLHNFEVVEVFIAGYQNQEDLPENPYLEIQIGPHGHYMLVAFEREEDWETQNSSIKLDRAPTTWIDSTHSRWFSEIFVPSFLLPAPVCSVVDASLTVSWHVNVCAIHGPNESRRFLSHSTYISSIPIPNFHRLECFVPLMLQETSSTSSPPPALPPPSPPLPLLHPHKPSSPPPPIPPRGPVAMPYSQPSFPHSPPPPPPPPPAIPPPTLSIDPSPKNEDIEVFEEESFETISDAEKPPKPLSLLDLAHLIREEQDEVTLSVNGLDSRYSRQFLPNEVTRYSTFPFLRRHCA